ncbi:MAG: ABC transporter ATP-binding protein [Geminicoccaceae bacterium]|nr:ABC transporter ATP-binding protein [Geminicoccaceae bacterium]
MLNVSIRDVCIDFGALRVLDRLNLEVEPGAFLVLLGPSGCGKSTLLNAIAGLIDISEGQIWIGERNVTWEEPKDRDIAMVFQAYALYPTMTVRRNLSFGLEMAKVPRDKVEEKVRFASELLQIAHLLDRKPSQLSGGQRQRVAIGRALVRDAGLFLFDEPLSNLDAKLRAEMRVEIKRLHQKLGITTIYVTHDQIEAMTMATKIAVMNGGVIEQLADPETVYETPATRFVADFVGSPGMNFLEAELAGSNGGIVARIGNHSLPLDSYPFARRPEQGQKVVFGLRPEKVRPLSEMDAPFDVELATELQEPMGADTLAWFRLAGQPLSARLNPASAHAAERSVRLGFDLSAVSLFDPQSGQRL